MKKFTSSCMNHSLIAVVILFMVMLTPRLAHSQTASISGKITDNASGEGLPGASVVIDGTTIGAMTNPEGQFRISGIAPGTVRLRISYIGYTTEMVDDLKLEAGMEKVVQMKLKENVNQLQGADVVAQRSTHTDNAVLMEVKQAEQIVTGISSQQISRSQDRTAGEVIRRIPGVTISETGFVNIRGLGERYNTIMLNGLLAPSMEADKKAFALDVIPGSMLDRLMIYKTGAPELPGEFAGGVIKIITKNVSDENKIEAGYSTGYRVNTTFSDFYQAPKGGTDWLGTDDGTRGLPGSFPESLYDVQNAAELTALGKKLPNAWTTARIKAMPDQRLSISSIQGGRIGKLKIGNVTALNYGMSNESLSAENYGYNSYDVLNQRSDTIYAYNDNQYKENVRLSLIHNWSFLVSPKTKIEFRNFFNQQGSNQATIRSGPNYEEGSLVKAYAYRYQERTVYSGQLTGTHDLFADRTKMDWALGYSYAHSAEPDFRRVRTKKNLDADSSTPYQVVIAPSASTLDAGRFYSDLNEHTGTVAMNFEHSLRNRNERLIPKIRTGIYYENKQREFSARWISYKYAKLGVFDQALLTLPLDQIFASQNINDSTGFKLEEGTNPSDQYQAWNNLMAGYVGTTWPFTSKWIVSGGVRVEYNRQQLESRDYSNKEISIDNPILSILPSINTSWNFTEKSLVRVAYAMTVNRPEFRELAPFAYYDFTFNNVLVGNEELETPRIHNMDIRYEWYPSGGEMITLGAFYKRFENPIEMFFVPGSGSGGTRNFTYGNAVSGRSTGIEVEIRKFFTSMLDTTGKAQSGLMRNVITRMGVVMNAALIDSKVSLGEKAVGQSESRPMMGQSPFIINTGLFYTLTESRFQASILYNIIGKRLFAVGTYGTPDIYYMPRNSLDITLSKGFGKYLEIKAGVQDLLAQDELFKQDSNENGKIDSKDETTFRIRRGAYYTLGFTVRL